ncbi:MAG TPA: flagellar motor protein MotB [Deltaproteobacteria bacterium]|nr:flagellar motor protein MotB [Deltaproteobacteria bacterium]HOM29558.1 flagellar motor protein MotB [Deltaproteobacteria bacterium]
MNTTGTKIVKVRRPDCLGWMTTFSDMVTLLLTFFVMIIAMSSLDSKALKETFGYFRWAAGVLEFPDSQELRVHKDEVQRERVVETSLQALSDGVDRALREQAAGLAGKGKDLVEVVEDRRGLAVRIKGDVLFPEGASTISEDARPVLMAVASVLKETSGTISVEGHTDAVGGEMDNRYLSLERASRVADFLVMEAGLKASRFCVAGYGMTKPVATNETPSGRRKNRRVEIVLLRNTL